MRRRATTPEFRSVDAVLGRQLAVQLGCHCAATSGYSSASVQVQLVFRVSADRHDDAVDVRGTGTARKRWRQLGRDQSKPVVFL